MAQTYTFTFNAVDFSYEMVNGYTKITTTNPDFYYNTDTCNPSLPHCVKNILLPPQSAVADFSYSVTVNTISTNIQIMRWEIRKHPYIPLIQLLLLM